VILETPVPARLPDQINNISNPDLLENITRLHTGRDLREEPVIVGTVLAFEENRRPSVAYAGLS